MTIKFPTAGGKFLESITACGRIKYKHLDKAARSAVKLHAPLKQGGRIRVVTSEARKGKDLHFHIDLSKGSYFRGEPPSAVDSLAEVEQLLSQFSGKPITVVATGYFAVPLKRVSKESTVGMLLNVSVGPKSEARLIGALYEVESEPVALVQWNRRNVNDSEEILASIESVSATVIDSGYFENLAAPLEAALRTMVLEERAEK